MTASAQGTINFTEMYATHEAFSRDLERLVAAADAGATDRPEVRAGWENLKTQLHIHHSVEDADLWPRTRRAAARRPDDLALLAEMEAEHALLDPLLTAVDRALAAGSTELSDRSRELATALSGHLRHEESKALPLIQSVLTPADWRGFKRAMARAQGISGAAVYIPWIIDSRPPAERRTFLARMPAPARLITRLVWEPRYRERNLWAF